MTTPLRARVCWWPVSKTRPSTLSRWPVSAGHRLRYWGVVMTRADSPRVSTVDTTRCSSPVSTVSPDTRASLPPPPPGPPAFPSPPPPAFLPLAAEPTDHGDMPLAPWRRRRRRRHGVAMCRAVAARRRTRPPQPTGWAPAGAGAEPGRSRMRLCGEAGGRGGVTPIPAGAAAARRQGRDMCASLLIRPRGGDARCTLS